jgi:hypothetical protein
VSEPESRRSTALVVLAVLLAGRGKGVEARDAEAERDAARILESYRALDALASAVLQTGVTVFIGGVTIGLAIAQRWRAVVIVGSFLPLLAGYLAAMAMIDPRDDPPNADRLAEKRGDVTKAALLLIVSTLCAVLIYMVLVTYV